MKISQIILGCVTATFLAVVVVALPVLAQSYGGGSVQSYSSETKLDMGTIVQLSGKDANKVKIATQSELQNMFGVVIDPSQLSVVVSDNTVNNEMYVAASGTYDVLVSTQNGTISSGDYVTLSSVDGIAMKAGTEAETVFGRANGSFDGKGIVLGKTTLKDVNGEVSRTVAIGKIPVTINIQRNPNIESTKTDVPEFLQRLGQQIAEKKVSPIRIYLSMAIAAVSLIMAIAVLYTGVRHAIIAIGRNPMSKKSIFRALAEVVLTSFLILIIGLFAVYLLLKL